MAQSHAYAKLPQWQYQTFDTRTIKYTNIPHVDRNKSAKESEDRKETEGNGQPEQSEGNADPDTNETVDVASTLTVAVDDTVVIPNEDEVTDESDLAAADVEIVPIVDAAATPGDSTEADVSDSLDTVPGVSLVTCPESAPEPSSETTADAATEDQAAGANDAASTDDTAEGGGVLLNESLTPDASTASEVTAESAPMLESDESSSPANEGDKTESGVVEGSLDDQPVDEVPPAAPEPPPALDTSSKSGSSDAGAQQHPPTPSEKPGAAGVTTSDSTVTLPMKAGQNNSGMVDPEEAKDEATSTDSIKKTKTKGKKVTLDVPPSTTEKSSHAKTNKSKHPKSKSPKTKGKGKTEKKKKKTGSSANASVPASTEVAAEIPNPEIEKPAPEDEITPSEAGDQSTVSSTEVPVACDAISSKPLEGVISGINPNDNESKSSQAALEDGTTDDQHQAPQACENETSLDSQEVPSDSAHEEDDQKPAVMPESATAEVAEQVSSIAADSTLDEHVNGGSKSDNVSEDAAQEESRKTPAPGNAAEADTFGHEMRKEDSTGKDAQKDAAVSESTEREETSSTTDIIPEYSSTPTTSHAAEGEVDGHAAMDSDKADPHGITVLDVKTDEPDGETELSTNNDLPTQEQGPLQSDSEEGTRELQKKRFDESENTEIPEGAVHNGGLPSDTTEPKDIELHKEESVETPGELDVTEVSHDTHTSEKSTGSGDEKIAGMSELSEELSLAEGSRSNDSNLARAGQCFDNAEVIAPDVLVDGTLDTKESPAETTGLDSVAMTAETENIVENETNNQTEGTAEAAHDDTPGGEHVESNAVFQSLSSEPEPGSHSLDRTCSGEPQNMPCSLNSDGSNGEQNDKECIALSTDKLKEGSEPKELPNEVEVSDTNEPQVSPEMIDNVEEKKESMTPLDEDEASGGKEPHVSPEMIDNVEEKTESMTPLDEDEASGSKEPHVSPEIIDNKLDLDAEKETTDAILTDPASSQIEVAPASEVDHAAKSTGEIDNPSPATDVKITEPVSNFNPTPESDQQLLFTENEEPSAVVAVSTGPPELKTGSLTSEVQGLQDLIITSEDDGPAGESSKSPAEEAVNEVIDDSLTGLVGDSTNKSVKGSSCGPAETHTNEPPVEVSDAPVEQVAAGYIDTNQETLLESTPDADGPSSGSEATPQTDANDEQSSSPEDRPVTTDTGTVETLPVEPCTGCKDPEVADPGACLANTNEICYAVEGQSPSTNGVSEIVPPEPVDLAATEQEPAASGDRSPDSQQLANTSNDLPVGEQAEAIELAPVSSRREDTETSEDVMSATPMVEPDVIGSVKDEDDMPEMTGERLVCEQQGENQPEGEAVQHRDVGSPTSHATDADAKPNSSEESKTIPQEGINVEKNSGGEPVPAIGEPGSRSSVPTSSERRRRRHHHNAGWERERRGSKSSSTKSGEVIVPKSDREHRHRKRQSGEFKTSDTERPKSKRSSTLRSTADHSKARSSRFSTMMSTDADDSTMKHKHRLSSKDTGDSLPARSRPRLEKKSNSDVVSSLWGASKGVGRPLPQRAYTSKHIVSESVDEDMVRRAHRAERRKSRRDVKPDTVNGEVSEKGASQAEAEEVARIVRKAERGKEREQDRADSEEAERVKRRRGERRRIQSAVEAEKQAAYPANSGSRNQQGHRHRRHRPAEEPKQTLKSKTIESLKRMFGR